MSTNFLSADRRRFIDDFAELLTPWGMPLQAARLYGYLMIKNEPVGLDEIAADLQMSKGKACDAGNLLEETGNAKRTKIAGSKRVFYAAPDDYSGPLIGQSRLLGVVAKLLKDRGPDIASGGASERLSELADYYLAMRAAMDQVFAEYCRSEAVRAKLGAAGETDLTQPRVWRR